MTCWGDPIGGNAPFDKERKEERVSGARVSKFVNKLESELEERNRIKTVQHIVFWCLVLVYQIESLVKNICDSLPRDAPLIPCLLFLSQIGTSTRRI